MKSLPGDGGSRFGFKTQRSLLLLDLDIAIILRLSNNPIESEVTSNSAIDWEMETPSPPPLDPGFLTRPDFRRSFLRLFVVRGRRRDSDVLGRLEVVVSGRLDSISWLDDSGLESSSSASVVVMQLSNSLEQASSSEAMSCRQILSRSVGLDISEEILNFVFCFRFAVTLFGLHFCTAPCTVSVKTGHKGAMHKQV